MCTSCAPSLKVNSPPFSNPSSRLPAVWRPTTKTRSLAWADPFSRSRRYLGYQRCQHFPTPGRSHRGATCGVCVHPTTCPARGGGTDPQPDPPTHGTCWLGPCPPALTISLDSQSLSSGSSASQMSGVAPNANVTCHSQDHSPRCLRYTNSSA